MSPKKIVIRTPNWLGDLMMSTAFINEVLRQFPDSQVDLIVKKGFETIPLPRRGMIHPFDKEVDPVFGFGKSLVSRAYDRFYVLPPSFSSALMAFASGSKQRIGYRGSLRGLFLNFSKSYAKSHRSQHLVAEYLQLLDDWSESQKVAPGLDISEEWLAKTLEELDFDLPHRFICIAPGAIYGPAKQWPVAHFKSLVDILNANNIYTIIIGTGADRQLGDYLSNNANRAENICGKTNLNQLIAVLAKSTALVSNDSGTMHIMAALHRPQVAIFGSTSTVWTGPVNDLAEIIKLDIDCSPCFKRVCPFGHTNCLHEITPDLVWKKLQPIIG